MWLRGSSDVTSLSLQLTQEAGETKHCIDWLLLRYSDYHVVYYEYLHALLTKARPHQINQPITMFYSYRNLPGIV
jgi:hypothetical protein